MLLEALTKLRESMKTRTVIELFKAIPRTLFGKWQERSGLLIDAAYINQMLRESEPQATGIKGQAKQHRDLTTSDTKWREIAISCSNLKRLSLNLSLSEIIKIEVSVLMSKTFLLIWYYSMLNIF